MNKIQEEAENNLANDPVKYMLLSFDSASNEELNTLQMLFDKNDARKLGTFMYSFSLRSAYDEAEEEIGYEAAEALHRQMDAEYKRAVAPQNWDVKEEK